MILLFHPRSTTPRSRRFPLSILSIAAVLEKREPYQIVDGNVDPEPAESLSAWARTHPIELLAVSVMPGPQMVAAMETCRLFHERFPQIPIVWGGYFPSLYPDAALRAPYVQYVVRGQGEDTFLELVSAIRGQAALEQIRGLSFKTTKLDHVHNPERVLASPDKFPWLPYHRLEAVKYILPTYLGRRTAVHQASLGCPFSCNFCGVVTVFGSREKMESPARTAAILQNLRETYRIDSIQFYDNNFFLKEDHAQELCQQIRPLHLKWWCEARIDIVLGYSDQTLQQIREAGCKMIFFGAESGSDWVLKEMKKQVRTEQTLLLAARIRRFGIVPEFSFVIGNPKDPERDTSECLQFIRKIKKLNPASEIILQHYTPVPQRDAMYGGIETEMQFPATVEEWANDRWLNFTLRKEPGVSWLPRRIKKKIDNFELVLNSSWPTVQDVRLPAWGRTMLKGLGRLRYTTKLYSYPIELEWAQQWIKLRKPKIESL